MVTRRPGPMLAAGPTHAQLTGPPRGHVEARAAPGKKVGEATLTSAGPEPPLHGRCVSGA